MAGERTFEDWRAFPPVPSPAPSVRGAEPMLVGILGPPGSGKTRTVLRMMRGVQRVFPGPLVLIDTEAGRSKTFSPKPGHPANPDDPVEPTYDFERIDLDAPFRSDRCLAAIKLALQRKPAAIGFDNLSDEHQGEGGYLEWHDAEVERVGGNEWGAWNRPAAMRKRLCSGIAHIAVPPVLFFTFVAEEKTTQVKEHGKTKVVNKGWTPVAPLLILKTLSLTCILPWDSKGTPIWESRGLPFEDFVRKWPDHLVRLMKPGQLTEDHGEALARWALGAPAQTSAVAPPDPRAAAIEAAKAAFRRLTTKEERADAAARHWGGLTDWTGITKLDPAAIMAGAASLARELDGLEALQAQPPETEPAPERLPGED